MRTCVRTIIEININSGEKRDFFVYCLDCTKFVLILDQETTFLFIHGYT